MRSWRYIEPGDDDAEPVVHVLTEDEIVRTYFAYWADAMRRAGKPWREITRQHCIDDFVVVHWAEPVPVSARSVAGL